MKENVMLVEIMKQLQKKYNCINEIYNLTKEVAEALSRDDRVSVQLVLGMRQDEMNKADGCDKAIELLIQSMEMEEQYQIRESLKKNNNIIFEGLEYKKIMEINNNIRTVVGRCVNLDKVMSKRMAGQDSFYMD
jgi:hypothetical protein